MCHSIIFLLALWSIPAPSSFCATADTSTSPGNFAAVSGENPSADLSLSSEPSSNAVKALSDMSGVQRLPLEALESLEKSHPENEAIIFGVALEYYDSGPNKNPEKAFSLFKKLSDKNHAYAQYFLAKCYEMGAGTSPDSRLAFSYCKRAADAGVIYAQRNVAGYYANGFGVPQNYPMAFYWLKKAAEGGDADCQYGLGEIYRTGRVFVDKRDYKQAVFWYQQAALQGHPDAQCALGLRYIHGQGVEKNIAEGCAWLVLSVQSGSMRARGILDTLLKQNMTPQRVQEVRALVIKHRSEIGVE